MITRRETANMLAAIMAAGLLGSEGVPALASAPFEPSELTPDGDPPQSRVHEVIRHSLPGMEGKVASLVTVSYAPGAASKPHRHPGPVFGYILEGAIVSQVEPGPPVTYKAGEAFYEPPMHVHRVSRNASNAHPAKLLAFEITDEGQSLTLPLK
jgi:quercetin dioxygenase-like cupin family protein